VWIAVATSRAESNATCMNDLHEDLHERTQAGHLVAGKVHAAVGLSQRRERLERRGRLRPP
jgi:hypothetical protein